MLRLILFRHAKAERGQPGARDHERALAERGRNDAPRLGAYLVRHELVPELVLVSTATRTKETWALAAAAFPQAPPVRFDERIYNAGPQTILTVIKETDPDVSTLMIVGHNPGLQELAALLVASGELEARQRLVEGFPTAALAVIDFALPAWGKLHPQSGRLHRFVSPRLLEAATD